jgi:CheY-like chemotaxis protein
MKSLLAVLQGKKEGEGEGSELARAPQLRLNEGKASEGARGKPGSSTFEQQQQQQQRQRQEKRVVIVDDEAGVRNMLRSLLKIKGYEVSASLSDGAELVDLLDEITPKPNVILLDERMPRMSGVGACKAIHSRHPEITIIFVSADDSAAEKARAAGAKAFLKKPVSVSELMSLLSSL